MRTTEAHKYRAIHKVAYNWKPNDWYCPPDCARQELFHVISQDHIKFSIYFQNINFKFLSVEELNMTL